MFHVFPYKQYIYNNHVLITAAIDVIMVLFIQVISEDTLGFTLGNDHLLVIYVARNSHEWRLWMNTKIVITVSNLTLAHFVIKVSLLHYLLLFIFIIIVTFIRTQFSVKTLLCCSFFWIFCLWKAYKETWDKKWSNRQREMMQLQLRCCCFPWNYSDVDFYCFKLSPVSHIAVQKQATIVLLQTQADFSYLFSWWKRCH